MVDYSPLFGSFSVGNRVSLVASLVTFDDGGTNHLMSSVISKNLFHFQGGIPQDKLTYSLLNVRVQQPMPRPILIVDESSHVLYHDACSWNSIRDLVEVCAGMGGLGQGLLSVGFRPVVACDQNPLMNSLYSTQSDASTVVGDVAQLSTVARIWELHPKSSTVAAGVSLPALLSLGRQGQW